VRCIYCAVVVLIFKRLYVHFMPFKEDSDDTLVEAMAWVTLAIYFTAMIQLAADARGLPTAIAYFFFIGSAALIVVGTVVSDVNREKKAIKLFVGVAKKRIKKLSSSIDDSMRSGKRSRSSSPPARAVSESDGDSEAPSPAASP
jgi:hypothetical protein